jgi:hypothetical protein
MDSHPTNGITPASLIDVSGASNVPRKLVRNYTVNLAIVRSTSCALGKH